MRDGSSLAERLLGLEGFRVLDVEEQPDELAITIESTRRTSGSQRSQ
jgi:hypothetical protein